LNYEEEYIKQIYISQAMKNSICQLIHSYPFYLVMFKEQKE